MGDDLCLNETELCAGTADGNELGAGRLRCSPCTGVDGEGLMPTPGQRYHGFGWWYFGEM